MRMCLTRPMSWRVSPPIVLISLYTPQLWFFLMDYPHTDYWYSWLPLFPGLPAFVPSFLVAHAMGGLLFLCVSWAGTALLIGTLLWLSRRKPLVFWGMLPLATALSIWSALAGYSAFRM